MPPAVVPAFNPTLMVGILEVGVFVATWLFGVTCVQTYLYFQGCKADSWCMKSVVWFMWLLDFGHTIAVCHFIYTLTITDYGEGLLSLYIPPASIDVAILLSGLIGTIEQAWFTRRLYIFSCNIYLSGICSILSFARFLGSVALSTVALHRLPLTEYTGRFGWLVTSLMAVAAANDVLLAVFLVYYLNRTKSRTINLSKVLDKLMIVAVESGAITSIGAVGVLTCFLTMPDNSIYIALFIILGKLYSNAFLASLNARRSFSKSFGDILSLSKIDCPTITSSQCRGSSPLTFNTLPQFVVTGGTSQNRSVFGMTRSGNSRQIIVTTEIEKISAGDDVLDISATNRVHSFNDSNCSQ